MLCLIMFTYYVSYSALLLLLLLLLLLVVTFMHGIYNYIPETNHVSAVYSVATIL